MSFYRMVSLAGVSLLSLSVPALAQPGSAEAGFAETDIVVQARRRDEVLQDVPQTINVVSSDTIERLRINSAADIAQIVPGIGVEGGTSTSGTFGSSSSIRGVPTFTVSNANPVVQFYLNDAPTGPTPGATQALFDIGQIEVLKGPQGTLRGRSAPTGAITIVTRRPDLDQAGGYATMSGTHRGNFNFQGAVGTPLIQDVLAIRIAGMIEETEGNGVTSVNNPIEPYVKSKAVRGTLRFEPSDNLSMTLMGQRLWRDTRSFAQLVGPGNGLNGPPIAARDRLGITDSPNDGTNNETFIVGELEWRFAGQRVNYVGSYRKGLTISPSPSDAANVIPGIEYFQFTNSQAKGTSHELRLSSDERVLGIFDYVVGGFYDRQPGRSRVNGVARFLSGAFGPPGGTAAAIDPVDRYTLRTAIDIDPVTVEKSLFGNVTAHLGEATELSVGGRYIHFKRHDSFTLNLRPGFNAINNPTGGFLPCAALGNLSPQLAGAVDSPIYAGACDIPIPANQLQNVDRREKFTPFLYNVSLSHKFTPDFMVYGNVGSAFRSAGPRIGLTSLLSCCTQAGGPDLGTIEDLVFQNQEKSTTYEIGFKASFFDKRARLNVAAFRQDFDNFYFFTQPVQYLAVTDPADPAGSGIVSTGEFTVGGDAKVQGVDIEAGFNVTSRWDVNLGFTWSKAKLSNALVPCNDSNFDGVPDTGVLTPQDFIDNRRMIARCRSNESIARAPRWNLTVQSEYAAPVNDRLDGFIRGSFVYYPENPNASQTMVIDNYSLLNLFVGLRGENNGWEVSLFANNLLNTKQILSFNAIETVSGGSPQSFFPDGGGSGYNQIGFTPRREFGLMLRYAFGSR